MGIGTEARLSSLAVQPQRCRAELPRGSRHHWPPPGGGGGGWRPAWGHDWAAGLLPDLGLPG